MKHLSFGSSIARQRKKSAVTAKAMLATPLVATNLLPF